MSSGILTIDDIASKNTPAIVDYLNGKGIRAIMFAVGENVERYYDQAIYALRGGMIVGNHSYSHPAFSALTPEECIAEIEKCEEVLNRLYRDAGVKREYRPFRFPYGDKGGRNHDLLQQYFREHGYDKVRDTQLGYPWWKEQHLDQDIDTLWSFDFAEYQIRPGTGFTLENVWARIHDDAPAQGASLLRENSRHILLLHAHDETDEMVPGYYRLFIERLLENGFSFEEPAFL